MIGILFAVGFFLMLAMGLSIVGTAGPAMSWQELKGLREKRGELIAAMRTLVNTATTAKRDLTAEESTKLAEHEREVERLSAQIETEERVQQWEAAQLRSMSGQGGVLAPKDRKRYSLLRAISLRADGKPLDGLEAEASAEIAKRCGKDPQGFYFPFETELEQRGDLDATTGAGAKLANVAMGNFIELLRNKLVVQQAGAWVLGDLVGDVPIPKQTGGGTAYWLAEKGTPTASNQTVGQVTLAVKTVGAFTDISRKFVKQTSLDAERFVREDLAKVLATAVDLGALNGSGTSNQPLGIMQDSDCPTVALGTNGLAPTWASIVSLETEVANANADLGRMAYVTNSKVRGKLKATEKFSSSGREVWEPGATPLNGYPALVSNQVPSNLTKGTSSGVCSAIIFGNWADLIIGMWGAVDIMVDPYSLSTAGTLRIVLLQDVDIQRRNDVSFAKILDALTT